MFVARADAFGLAQLYQLRGRIAARTARVLLPAGAGASSTSPKTPAVGSRYSSGSPSSAPGSRSRRRIDLEIRGGGELLGAKQSGSIAAVGFDQYVKMLEAAVAELDGKPIHRAIDPELSIETPGPRRLRPDPGQRPELYKRLSAIDTDDDLTAVMRSTTATGRSLGDVLLLGELMGEGARCRRRARDHELAGRDRRARRHAAGPRGSRDLAAVAGWQVRDHTAGSGRARRGTSGLVGSPRACYLNLLRDDLVDRDRVQLARLFAR